MYSHLRSLVIRSSAWSIDLQWLASILTAAMSKNALCIYYQLDHPHCWIYSWSQFGHICIYPIRLLYTCRIGTLQASGHLRTGNRCCIRAWLGTSSSRYRRRWSDTLRVSRGQGFSRSATALRCVNSSFAIITYCYYFKRKRIIKKINYNGFPTSRFLVSLS